MVLQIYPRRSLNNNLKFWKICIEVPYQYQIIFLKNFISIDMLIIYINPRIFQIAYSINMHMNPANILKEKLNFECPICLQDFDDGDRFPMIICPNQHTCCFKCTDQYVFKDKGKGQCPLCKQAVDKTAMIKFRFLNEIKLAAQQMGAQSNTIRKNAENLEQCKALLSEEKEKNMWLIMQCQHKEGKMRELKQKSETFGGVIKNQEFLLKQYTDLISEIKGQKMPNKQFERQLANKEKEMKEVQQNYKQKIQGLQLQNEQLKKQNARLKKLVEQMQIQQLKSSTNIKKIDKSQQKIEAQHWVDPQCYYYKNKKLTLNGNAITLQEQCNDGFVFGSLKLTNQQCQFKVQVNKIDNYFAVGVIDERYKQKKNLWLQQCPNWVFFNSQNTILNQLQWTRVDEKLNQGEIVIVRIDFNSGTVSWTVNGATKANVNNKNLLDKTIKWVPYLHMYGRSAMAIIG